jgi:hypothetical protein
MYEGKFLLKTSEKKGPALKVERSSITDRQAMIKSWMAAGWTVEAEDFRGRKVKLVNFGVRLTPGPGLIFSVTPEPSSVLEVTMGDGQLVKMDLAEVRDIDRKGDAVAVVVTKHDGSKVSGVLATTMSADGHPVGRAFEAYEPYSIGVEPKPFTSWQELQRYRFMPPANTGIPAPPLRPSSR